MGGFRGPVTGRRVLQRFQVRLQRGWKLCGQLRALVQDEGRDLRGALAVLGLAAVTVHEEPQAGRERVARQGRLGRGGSRRGRRLGLGGGCRRRGRLGGGCVGSDHATAQQEACWAVNGPQNTVVLEARPEGSPVVLAAYPSSTGLTVEVRDGGPGLTEADAAVAFERGALFARYNGERPVGSGLGLSITARIVQRMGGCIGVRAAPEGGAAFVVELPGIPVDSRQT